MILRSLARLAYGVLTAAGLMSGALAEEPQKTIKIGVVYDLTGPFAGGGSELHYLGAKIMIDYFAKKGVIVGAGLTRRFSLPRLAIVSDPAYRVCRQCFRARSVQPSSSRRRAR